MEFFVAKRIAKQIEAGLTTLEIKEKLLPPVISEFVQSLLVEKINYGI
jgi:hypothetical protein